MYMYIYLYYDKVNIYTISSHGTVLSFCFVKYDWS